MSRRANSKNLDPMRFAPEAKQLSNLPGSPENTNPMNMRAAGQEGTPPIGGPSIYNDSNQRGAYPIQTGTAHLDPNQYKPSQMSNMPVGQKLNAGFNYGQQPQPSANAGDPMEGMRLGQNAQMKGLMAHPYLGMTGSPALIPGAMDARIPGQGQGLMQPMITVDGQNNPKKGAKA
jgi:hypothetical protein